MREFNYSNYVKALKIGIESPNKTEIARILFEPIICNENVKNQSGNPYTIDSKIAKDWYDQIKDIPRNIKHAAGSPEIVNSIADYFSDKVIDGLINQLKEKEMYEAMLELINNSNLHNDVKKKLLSYYEDQENAEFLGHAFLYSLVGNNKTKDNEDEIIQEIDQDLVSFKDLIKRKYKKPDALKPPNSIEQHEIRYVEELYKVYSEKSGKKCSSQEDLNAEPKLKRNFDAQRKSYYLAETIRRELRDSMLISEKDGFDVLKDEVYEGVINVRDRDFDLGYDRLNAVIDQATLIQLSNNLNNILLDWVGAGEKKGVCHILVNDERLTWMDEKGDDDD